MASIGLLSDVHATPAPVQEALAIFQQAGVQEIFCAGDTAGYHDQLEETVVLLEDSGVRAVRGNHDLRYLDLQGADADDRPAAWFRQLPAVIDTVIAGKRVYMVHAQPPDACTGGGIRLLDSGGKVRPDRAAFWTRQLATCDCDVLIVGHTHQVFAERLGATLVVNPGSTVFNHCCAILHLPELAVQLFPLSGRAISRYWNWSEQVTGRHAADSNGTGV
jgi:predicted phosphodiesterase